jgi:hypothetical protein
VRSLAPTGARIPRRAPPKVTSTVPSGPSPFSSVWSPTGGIDPDAHGDADTAKRRRLPARERRDRRARIAAALGSLPHVRVAAAPIMTTANLFRQSGRRVSARGGRYDVRTYDAPFASGAVSFVKLCTPALGTRGWPTKKLAKHFKSCQICCRLHDKLDKNSQVFRFSLSGTAVCQSAGDGSGGIVRPEECASWPHVFYMDEALVCGSAATIHTQPRCR